MELKKSLSIILLAGGKGSRLASLEPKQFLKLEGKAIARHCLDSFLNLPLPIQDIVVVCEPQYQPIFDNPLKKILFASPGIERQFSVLHGFEALRAPVDYIMIHDTARPFIQEKDILLLFEEGASTGAAALGTPVTSTIKQATNDNYVTSTLPRTNLWEMQTPQLLNYMLLKKGLEKIVREHLTVTDDVSLAELLNHPVKIIKGNSLNFKITTEKDLLLANTVINSSMGVA